MACLALHPYVLQSFVLTLTIRETLMNISEKHKGTENWFEGYHNYEMREEFFPFEEIGIRD